MSKNEYKNLGEKYKDILNLPWGFQVGPGWYELISELLSKIKKTKLNSKFIIVQVKEKFGGLRVYTQHANDEQLELIEEYEKKSYEVCEDCGKPGTMRTDDWHHVTCDVCEAKR